jgi:hypothetical protein
MSLAPSERRALARIEDSLRSTDHKLAAKVATFNVLASRGRVPRWKWLSPWRLRLKRIIPITVAVAALGVLILTAIVFSHSGQSRDASCGVYGVTGGRVNCTPAGGPSRLQNRTAGNGTRAGPATGSVSRR